MAVMRLSGARFLSTDRGVLDFLEKVPIILPKIRAIHPGPGLPPVIKANQLAVKARTVQASPGAAVTIVDESTGDRLGWGLWNPHTRQYHVRALEACGVVSHVGSDDVAQADEAVDTKVAKLISTVLHKQIEAAVAFRRDILGLPGSDTDVFRLINREGDHLSGLAVDVLGTALVVRSSALWTELHRPTILTALRASWSRSPCLIVWQREVDSLVEDGFEAHFGYRPDVDGAEAKVEVHTGDDKHEKVGVTRSSEHGVVSVREAGVVFEVSPGFGKKTGHFVDQRENRRFLRSMMRALVAGRAPTEPPLRVLDLFCYNGGFGVSAALGVVDGVTAGNAIGASCVEVIAVDMSASAVDEARRTAILNGVGNIVRVVHGNAFKFLQEEAASGRLFDVVVCDPPRAVCSRGWSEDEMRRAIAYHRRATVRCMRVLRTGGILVACTCSQVLTQARTLLLAVQQAAAAEGRSLRLLSRTGSGADHVLHPAWRPEGHLDVIWLMVN
eukprot:TRINITY_DN24975_c0_g1_i1.p1 TRINITY_DN24975_c0_g1~~TRINITY_DN24975_c0_g1_i1.p1  ORF type:complete len:519 (-),score=68.52 TRINITY_DN24975_c0_g1_i1:119-1618(-)